MFTEDISTPEGVLTDAQAAAIRAAGGPAAAPPELRTFFTGHLAQYDAFRQSFPRAVDLQEMARKDRVLEDLTLDFDRATAGQDLMSLRMAPDEPTRAAAKDSLVVDTYIRSKTGRGFNGATRAKMRDAVATTLFGEGKGLGSDTAFVTEARRFQTKGRETRIQAESFASAGAWDALKLEPGDPMADLARIQESAKAVEGMTPEDAERFFATYRRMREETEAKAGPYRPVAKAVRQLLEAEASKNYTGDSGGDEDFGLALDMMLSLPDDAVPYVFSMIRGKRTTDDKSGGQKALENAERGLVSRLRTWAEPALRGRLMDLGRNLEAGAPLTIRDGDSVERAVLRRVGETTLPMAEAGQAAAEGQAFYDYFNSRTATPAENRQAAEVVKKMLARNIMAGRLVNLSEQSVDPATSSDFYARSLYGTAYSIGAMAPVFIPYAGLVIAQGSYANDEFHRLTELGVDAETANFNSQITGGIQAGLERLGVHALTAGYSNLAAKAGASKLGTAIGNVLYRFPGLNRTAPGVLPLNAAGRIVGGLGLTQTGEYLEETAQDATPIFTAALAERMGMSLPEQATMEAEVKRFKFWNPEMYLSLLPITGAMGGFRSFQNNADAVRQREALLADPVAMRAAGAVPELAERIAALPEGQRAEAWKADAPKLDPSTESAGEAQETLTGRQTLAARRTVEERQAAGIAAIRRTDSGWQVERMDGVTVSVSSAEAAESMVRDLAQAATVQEAEALVSIADQWHSGAVPGEGRQTTFTGAVTRGTNEGIFRERNGQMVQEITDEETLRNLREEATMDGAADVNVIINGSNRAFTETVADGARRVVQALEVNQTASNVVTLLHEQSERNLRSLLDSGSVTETDMVSALNFAAMALPESALPDSDADGKAFRQRVMRGALGELTVGQLRETVVELAVADTLGRRKDGGRFEAGAITRALTASIQSAGSAAELKGIQKFLAMLRAVRAYLRGVMGTVAGLRKARRDGTLAEGNTLDVLLDKITGRDQQQAHNEAVTEEVARDAQEQSPALPELWARWAAAQPPLSQAEKRSIGALTAELRAAYGRIVQRNGGNRTVGLTALAAESGIQPEDMQRWVLEYGINQGMAALDRDGIRLNDAPEQAPPDESAAFSVSPRAQPVEKDAPVKKYSNGTVVGPATFQITAYHGTPHKVREFSTANIGTGEGRQVFGWGLYFAESIKTAEWYRETLAADGEGSIYTVELDVVEDELLDWDSTFEDQPEAVKARLLEIADIHGGTLEEAVSPMKRGNTTGESFYSILTLRNRTPERASRDLAAAGIKGIRYLDGSSRGASAAKDFMKRFTDAGLDFRADSETVMEAVDAGAFSEEDAAFLRELADNDWLGLDYPIMGVNTALSRYIKDYDVSPELIAMAKSRRGPDTYNYVVFKDAYIKITAENGKPVEQPQEAAATFSLSSVSALEAVAAKLEARMAAGGPEAKLTVLGDIARTVAGMARAARYNEETENVIAAGRIEERRRALRQELLERYTMEVLESPVGMALLNDEAVSVRDLAVTGQVLDLSRKGLHGVFLAPSKARKAGMRLAGEYDDAAGLPGWMFHGERTPDEVATSLGMDVAEMWATIHDELGSMKRMREYQISAREQMTEARVRAGTEAAEWASQQRAKLAVSDARDARRALVTLDAMIAKLPAEVRRSVGGFTPVADLKTNKAREEYFLRTVDKIDRALERHLRKEYTERIKVLFRKAAVKAKPGQGDRGGLTVNGHTWFQQAEAITRMGERALAEREAWVRSRISGTEELKAEEVTELNRLWDFGGGVDGATLALEQEDALLNLFGGFSHTEADGSPTLSALELETAMNTAQEQLTAGRTKWETALAERRMWRVTRRLQLQNDSKTTGLPDAIAARKKALDGFSGRMQDFFQKGFSFEQLIGDIFKRGSATHQYAERTARSAEIKAKADWMSRQLQFQDFLKTLWPRSGSTARLKRLEELATRHKVPGAPQELPEMSELEAVHYTMLWADQDSRDWLSHYKFGDDAQAAMEAWLSPAARSIRTWLQERYDAQYDEINEVYRRIHGVNMPRVANYAPRIVEHGQATSTMDPLNPASPEGLGVFAGFTKRRRPQISSMPIQTDALSAYWMNQRVTGHWRAWAEPMRELRAVFSNPETAPYIKAAAGDKAANMVNQWLTDMEQGGRREVMTIEAMRRFLSTNADNALVGKLGVLAKQVPAAYGSAAEIGWDSWLTSVRRITTGKASITLEEIYNSQVMRQRRWADLPETLQSAHGTGTHPFARALRKVGLEIHAIDTALDWMRQRIGWTDAFFTTLSAAAAYDAHYRDAVASGSTDGEARAEAEARASITVARTAQPDSLVNKSIYENGLGTWGRLFFAFQSANRQALFMTAAAFRDGGIKSGEAWRKALTHWMLTGIVTQTLGSLVRDWVSDDDEEEIWTWGGYGRAVLMGPLTGALYLGTLADVAGGLMGGFERRSGTGLGAAVGGGVREIVRVFRDEDAAFDLKSFDKVARGLGYALGGRASGLNMIANIWKQIEGTADNAVETEAEKIEKKANKQRESEKEKKKAEADALPKEEKERRKQEKKARKEAGLKEDAAKWDAAHPEGE